MVKFKFESLVKLHPLKTAALTIAVLLYGGFLKQADPFVFRSLIQAEKLTALEGCVASNPVKTASGRFYSVLLDTESVLSSGVRSSASGRVKLLVPAETVEALYPGKLYSIAGEAVPVEEGARLLCSGHTLPSEGSAGSGVSGEKKQLFFGPPVDRMPVFIAETISFSGWKNGLTHIRALCRLYLKRILYAWKDAGGLLLALMSGSREYTDGALAEAFKNAGLSHILALSGMHLSLFISAAALVSVFAGKRTASVLSVVLMCLFIWFAGASASLVRAFLCLILMMITRALSIQTYESAAFDCLCGAFIIQTAFLHADIYNPAFMLSYAAVAGILIVTPLIAPFLRRFLPRVVSDSIAASLGAWIFTAPITALLFGSITPVGIVASIVVTPIASLFFVAGCACVVLCFTMPFLIVPLGAFMQVLYIVLKYTVLFFGRFPPIVFGG